LLVRIEIINTGGELLLGRVLNTHQQWLCRQLADLGYAVDRQVAVDDSGLAIQHAVREALTTADLVIVTGGLGPTSDDRTRDLIAELLHLELIEDPQVIAHVEQMFATRGRRMPVSTRVQAQVPRGATVLMNAQGTAPGLLIEVPALNPPGSARLLVMLPGPPRELCPMFLQQVCPEILKRFPRPSAFICRTLKTTGMGESLVEERIARPLLHLTQQGLVLGYCARLGEVDIRFVARGDRASEIVVEAERVVRDLLGSLVFGVDDDQLEATIVRRLTERRQTLAVAESCTGGFIAHRLTNVPGASAVFLAGWVTYGNEAKQQFLGVPPETLEQNGAVSEATARAMAEGARERAGAHYAISVTGIAGPGGGTADKPVGTVWMALAAAGQTSSLSRLNVYDRETFKLVTSQQALDLLRRHLEQGPSG
jgi:nicotinamide-nucleotide amidase